MMVASNATASDSSGVIDVMRATPQPRVFTFREDVEQRAAQLWAMRVRDMLDSQEEVVLLLSGGSNVDMYATALEFLPGIDASGITLGLVDERYGAVGHADSNEAALREAGVIQFFEEAGARFVSMLRAGESLEDTVMQISDEYEAALESASGVLYSVGIGGGGHTAGWLPRGQKSDFEDVAFATEAVVGYELGSSETDNPHRQRLTTTLGFLSSMQEKVSVVVYAAGESKERALRDFIRTESLEDISQLPARGLYVLDPQLTLLTDRDVA